MLRRAIAQVPPTVVSPSDFMAVEFKITDALETPASAHAWMSELVNDTTAFTQRGYKGLVARVQDDKWMELDIIDDGGSLFETLKFMVVGVDDLADLNAHASESFSPEQIAGAARMQLVTGYVFGRTVTPATFFAFADGALVDANGVRLVSGRSAAFIPFLKNIWAKPGVSSGVISFVTGALLRAISPAIVNAGCGPLPTIADFDRVQRCSPECNALASGYFDKCFCRRFAEFGFDSVGIGMGLYGTILVCTALLPGGPLLWLACIGMIAVELYNLLNSYAKVANAQNECAAEANVWYRFCACQ